MAPPLKSPWERMGDSSIRRWLILSQDQVGWGTPTPPPKKSGKVRAGKSPAPTEIMAPTDSQDRVADVDDDSLNGSDGEIDVVEEAISVEEAEKRGPGRPPTTGEHVGKKAREEEKPKFGKRRRRNEGQPNPSE